MEVKVSVDGVPRVVCGITDETTCQEVVTALAQALGQSGRYMLRERFKEFERCMAPNECLLDTLKKYGEQAREVQLTLLHNGPSVWDDMSRAKVGRHQPCPPLRRKDAGARMRRGSASLHRQSLPPLSCTKQGTEKQQEDLKKPKRKSLTLMEEARDWLESLGKGKVYSTACSAESSKRTDKRSRRSSLGVVLSIKGDSGRSQTTDLDQPTSCCMGTQTRMKESKQSPEGKCDNQPYWSYATSEDEKHKLREMIIHQLSYLQDMKIQMTEINKEIFELETLQRTRKVNEEIQQRLIEEELEQIQFWENELKAEEGYKKDLQSQFLEMRAKAVDCKAKLQEYKHEMEGLDYLTAQNIVQEDAEEAGVARNAASVISSVSATELDQQRSEPDGDVDNNRKLQPRENVKPPSPPAPFQANQIKERRPTGPTELREWWKRWSEAQSSKAEAKMRQIHRSELTIYLGSTRV